MEFYKGSHAEPLMEHLDDYNASNMLTRGQCYSSIPLT